MPVPTNVINNYILQQGRQNLIILTYSFLAISFLMGKSPSLFLYLITLLIELLILVISFSVNELFSPKKQVSDSSNVFLGTTIFLLFNYAIIFYVAQKFENFNLNHYPTIPAMLVPIVIYRDQLIVMAIGLLISYLINFISIRKQDNKLELIAVEVIKKGIIIWLIVLLAVVLAFIIPDNYFNVYLITLPLARIALEFSIVRKLFNAIGVSSK